MELVRTQELLRRFLPAPPTRLLDVGGATGAYAGWLARDGYDVHVVDPVTSQVARAARLDDVTASVGDARFLAVADASVEGVLRGRMVVSRARPDGARYRVATGVGRRPWR